MDNTFGGVGGTGGGGGGGGGASQVKYDSDIELRKYAIEMVQETYEDLDIDDFVQHAGRIYKFLKTGQVDDDE